jgi:hypothetical protein
MQSQNLVSERMEDWDMRLERRQARVGIVANPVKVALPPGSPREVWTRWPKLRSARRLEAMGHAGQGAYRVRELGLDEQCLSGFLQELRDPAPRQPAHGLMPEMLFAKGPVRLWMAVGALCLAGALWVLL